MKRLRVLSVFLVAWSSAGCDDTVLGLPIGDIGGLWTSATYEWVDNANDQNRVDLVAQDGALLTLSIDTGNNPPTVSAQFDDGSGGGWTAVGEVNVAQAELTIGAGVFFIEHDGNSMTLTNVVAVYNFGFGVVPATVVAEMDRL